MINIVIRLRQKSKINIFRKKFRKYESSKNLLALLKFETVSLNDAKKQDKR